MKDTRKMTKKEILDYVRYEVAEAMDQTGLTEKELLYGYSIEEVAEAIDQSGITLEDALEMATLEPAE